MDKNAVKSINVVKDVNTSQVHFRPIQQLLISFNLITTVCLDNNFLMIIRNDTT